MIPRWYQQQANDAAWNYLAKQEGNPLIVLPTGAGKSLVIAMLCRQAIEFGAQVIVLQHRKELIQQNAEKIQILLPEIPVGLYSAGLYSKQTKQPILCAGIQSVYRKAADIGERQLIVIDEAHLVSASDESMYGQFLSDIIELNPTARVAGCTATPFRTGEGPICGKKKLFQRICFEAFTGDLIEQGFLCEITNKPSEQVIDTSSLKLRGGEFIESDLQKVFGGDDTVLNACREIVEKTQDRHSVLVFCSGVAHADNVADTLHRLTGERTAVITGDTLTIERAAYLQQFKSGELRWLVNCDVLTTGFDAPCIDAIAILRATMSPGLFAQMVGRGLRKHDSKRNCIAEGQRVLTDHGLVEIQNITEAMKIWDGIEFVSHCGIVLRGEKPVIVYAGLTSTGDHNVWTKEGWKKAGECAVKQIPVAVTGMAELEIKLSDCYFRNSYSSWQEEQAVLDDCLRGVREEREKGCGYTQNKNCWLQEVWKKTKLSEAVSWCSEMAFSKMYISKEQMHKFQQQLMGKLWRAWNNIRIRFPKPYGCLPYEKLFNHTGSGDRPHQQRSGLCAREYQGRECKVECEQQERQMRNSTNAQVQAHVSRNKICGQHVIWTSKDNDFQGSHFKVSHEVMQAKRRVWDIVNCGPRNRFTCEGLLVSNCTLLDFGGNIERHGSLDDRNYGRARSSKPGSAQPQERNGRGRECLNCKLDVPAGEPECPECGFRFPGRHQATADTDSQLTGEVTPETWIVEACKWGTHYKKNDPEAPPTLRIDYECQPVDVPSGNLTAKHVSEWVCLEHQNFARVKACLWWEQHSLSEVPETIAEAIDLLDRGACRMPSRITTVKDGKYTRIKSVEFVDEMPEDWLEETQPEHAEETLVNDFGDEVPF